MDDIWFKQPHRVWLIRIWGWAGLHTCCALSNQRAQVNPAITARPQGDLLQGITEHQLMYHYWSTSTTKASKSHLYIGGVWQPPRGRWHGTCYWNIIIIFWICVGECRGLNQLEGCWFDSSAVSSGAWARHSTPNTSDEWLAHSACLTLSPRSSVNSVSWRPCCWGLWVQERQKRNVFDLFDIVEENSVETKAHILYFCDYGRISPIRRVDLDN